MSDNNGRLEFDKPSNPKIPGGISIVQHVAGRIRELKQLYNDIATYKSEKLLHQMLPNYMRRRAMSHNPKRLPLKYRHIHVNQMAKSGPNAKKRRPSRKYRRKPSNLVKEYNRRQQKNVWLETHIWHAKRYHMKELWGYKIPYASTDKRYRASYKAAAYHCLVQDISYVSAIEITGPLEELRTNFKRICSQDCGPTLMAKSFLSGSREGETDLFKIDAYPKNALSRVSFMWKPTEEDMKVLWIFVHPTAYREVLQELVILFQLKNDSRNDIEEASVNIITRNDSLLRNPRYSNKKSRVDVIELKDTLNRFRVTGPYSNSVLCKALKPASHLDNNWLGNLIAEDLKFQKAHTEQERVWSKLQGISSSELPPHSILGLNVVDPRTNRPTKREKALNDFKLTGGNFELLPIAALSGIWRKDLRDNVTKQMVTTGELCQLRNKNQLVPGVAASFEKDLQPVPLLMLQRPGSQSAEYKRLGFGSGWDLIVPAGYGMSVWLSLIKCGAKSGGWQDLVTVTNEIGNELFLPDTVSGLKESERQLQQKREEYFRKPPNKRTNFKKMGIASPFACPFSQLVKEYGGSENFYVLRCLSSLDNINGLFSGQLKMNELKISNDALIPINLSMESRGTPGDFGIICLPSKRDIKNSILKKHQRDRGPLCIQPVIKDEAELERKNLVFKHKKLLKRLRNRRVRAKRKLQSSATRFVKIQKSTAEKAIEEHWKKNCELWLPNKPATIRDQCSKQVIGYLNKSRFTFSEGKVSGVGYLTRTGLQSLIEVFLKFKGLDPFVLTRSTKSKCFYSAAFTVRRR